VDEADEAMVEVEEDGVSWRFERSFLNSHWACIWGRGCLGILPTPAEHLGQGCCSLGADLDGEDEARLIGALAATLDAGGFEHHEEARAGGVFADETRTSTRVVDGACIFLNRPGFAGGAGCALHRAAEAAGEAPRDWKPSVCWQLPIRVDWAERDGGGEVATLRRWSRADWGVDGETMAWCCTEGERAYVGDRPVIESLAGDIEAITGPEVFVALRRKVAGG
jgi:hypothetical protein